MIRTAPSDGPSSASKKRKIARLPRSKKTRRVNKDQKQAVEKGETEEGNEEEEGEEEEEDEEEDEEEEEEEENAAMDTSEGEPSEKMKHRSLTKKGDMVEDELSADGDTAMSVVDVSDENDEDEDDKDGAVKPTKKVNWVAYGGPVRLEEDSDDGNDANESEEKEGKNVKKAGAEGTEEQGHDGGEEEEECKARLVDENERVYQPAIAVVRNMAKVQRATRSVEVAGTGFRRATHGFNLR